MKYHKREITFDEKTGNFKVTVPELGLEVLYDTEMGALLEMRKEVAEAAKRPQPPEVGPMEIPIEQYKREFMSGASSADINDAFNYLNGGNWGNPPNPWGQSPADDVEPPLTAKQAKHRREMREYFEKRNEDVKHNTKTRFRG